MSTLHLSDDVLLQLRACLIEGLHFDLPSNVQKSLLDQYNIKIQSISQGTICFQGVNIGSAVTAASSGMAFALLLKTKGLNPETISSDAIEEALCSLPV